MLYKLLYDLLSSTNRSSGVSAKPYVSHQAATGSHARYDFHQQAENMSPGGQQRYLARSHHLEQFNQVCTVSSLL